tara:strand:- start:74 stop:247 length:174 start_codon:yes stop_codon:yes gene_type:complete
MKSGFRLAVTYLGFFVFFDIDNLVVIGNGFQKKSQKTPKNEIERAEQIRQEYYDSKE